MAEKKTHKIVSASTGENVTNKPRPTASKPAAQATGNAGGLRVGAVLLWIAALAFEVVAIMLVFKKITFLPKIQPIYKAIGALVIDLICVIIGSMLWKKANHIAPASQKNAVKFWLWNNMGVIVSAIAFIPFIILLLTNKDVDKKSKTIGTIVAAVFALGAGLASYEWNPYSREAQELAQTSSQVYWTAHGKKFHLYTDCSSLDRTEELITGTAQEAIEANRGTICKFCEKRYAKELEDADTEAAEALVEAAVNE